MRVLLSVMAVSVLVMACAPTTTIVPVQSQEIVVQRPFSEVFSLVASAINTQPYPSDSGGWVIVRSDQVGGFISAELNGRRWELFQGLVQYRAVVSIAFVDRGNVTALNISSNRLEEANSLVRAIHRRLGI